MKFLLTAVNAKYIHSNLAIYSLRAAAGACRNQVELAEFTINHRTEEILREIYLRKPDVLLFSCYIWNIVYVEELVSQCRKVLPEVPVWLGGPEVSYDAPGFLDNHKDVDGILCGEGEETFRLLAECYVRGQADEEHFSQIPGLVFRGEDKIRINPPAALPDLDALPFPYEDLKTFENRIMYYESSRGCPFSCSYCLSSIDKGVRFRSTEKVCRELQVFLDAKVPQVKFVDRTFNCRHSHALAIWRYLTEHDNGITNFHFEISADLLNEEELELIGRMRPGLIQLETGVQSANSRTLEAVCRNTDLQRLGQTVRRIKAGENVHQHLDLIAGLPFEDYESFGRSFDVVAAMEPEQLQLGFLKVLKGSQMSREARKYGILYKDQPPYEVLGTPWLSFGDILKLKMIEEMVEIYYNSHQFRVTLHFLTAHFAAPFAFFEALADAYESKGLAGRRLSRVQKYQFLLEFARERFPEEEARICESLTVDYYLRERARTRPSFAPEQSGCLEELRRICRKAGREKHVELLKDPAVAQEACRETRQGEAYLVFDYEKRSPLTGDAEVFWWKEEQDEVKNK